MAWYRQKNHAVTTLQKNQHTTTAASFHVGRPSCLSQYFLFALKFSVIWLYRFSNLLPTRRFMCYCSSAQRGRSCHPSPAGPSSGCRSSHCRRPHGQSPRNPPLRNQQMGKHTYRTEANIVHKRVGYCSGNSATVTHRRRNNNNNNNHYWSHIYKNIDLYRYL